MLYIVGTFLCILCGLLWHYCCCAFILEAFPFLLEALLIKAFHSSQRLFHKLFALPDCSCQSVESRQRFESIIDILHQDGVIGLCHRCHQKLSSSKLACMIHDIYDWSSLHVHDCMSVHLSLQIGYLCLFVSL